MTDLIVMRWGAQFGNRRFPCSIGRGGITRDKHEGDGATPQGVHGITGLLYRPDRIGAIACRIGRCPSARPICGLTIRAIPIAT